MTEADQWLPWSDCGEESCCKRARENFLGDGDVLYFRCGGGYKLYTFKLLENTLKVGGFYFM